VTDDIHAQIDVHSEEPRSSDSSALTGGGLVVALDGPSSSGKSTVGAEAARLLGYRFCDTGLLYRAVTWLALERGIPSGDLARLLDLAGEVSLEADEGGKFRRVRAAGLDVTEDVCGEIVDAAVSDYAKVAELRAALIPRQRELARDGAIIVAGRDIGTVILPDADVKIYLDASAEERARRRAAQRRATDANAEQQILTDLRRRDSIDSTRQTAPLRAADDAIVVQSDGLDFGETVQAVVEVIRSAAAAGSPARGRASHNRGSGGELGR
jgi:cytidylate kinase